MTAQKYANQAYRNGQFPMMSIVAGEYGTFWLHDADWKLLDGPTYTTREAAEKARSRIIEKAARQGSLQ